MLHYIYSVLHSPTYRTRYAPFLKMDFPRIPFASNLELFRSLTILGKKLTGLHLLESDIIDDDKSVSFSGNADAEWWGED
ncbi:MAG: type ISP restriction/modification enzyme [Caldisericia bacterium]